VNGLAQFADDKLLKLTIPLTYEAREDFVRFARLAHQEKMPSKDANGSGLPK